MRRLTDVLGIEHPIIQGPFGGFASQKLTAAVSDSGGLGSFGGLGLTPDQLQEVIAELRSLTSRPFAVNLWVSTEDEAAFDSGEAAFQRSLAPIAGHIERLGGTLPTYKPYERVRFEDQVRVLIDERVPVFSFIFGIPPKEILDECRVKGIVTAGAATSVEEAIALQKAGVDVVVASGFEAGGHRGSFLRAAEESLMGTFSLVPQVVDAVELPVVAAGGIGDARGVAAAFALGAEGVQVGTAFFVCEGSGITEPHRRMILQGRAGRTGLTKGFTGRLARGIRNQLMEEMNRADTPILPYPLQRQIVRSLTTAAQAAGDTDLQQLWAGQSANLARSQDAAEVMRELAKGVPGVRPL